MNLTEKLRAQREHRVELLPGKFLRFRRPLENDLPKLRDGITLELLCQYVVGWDFTEADLLPEGVGSGDPAPFSYEAAIEVLGDRSEWREKVALQLVEVVTDWLKRKAEVAKN